MQFDNWQAFWHMGGYALYVWLSFGITLVAMAGIAWSSAREHTRLMQSVLHEQARRARIKEARRTNPTLSASVDAQ